jgi:hypothetical protein
VLPLLVLLAGSGGQILGARLEAEVPEGGDVSVRLSYRIEKEVAEQVAFSLLEIDGVAIDEVFAVAGEIPLPVELLPRSGPRRDGIIGIPGGETSIELRYVVKGGSRPAGNGFRARLPLAILDLEIEETRVGLFSSAIGLPSGFSVVEGFPSQPVAGRDGATNWELPLVPTFVAFRASPGAVLLTPPRVATAAVAVLLLTVGVVGVRRARAVRA